MRGRFEDCEEAYSRYDDEQSRNLTKQSGKSPLYAKHSGAVSKLNMTRCPMCGKKPVMSTTRVLLRGHYNPTVKSKRYPNLQWSRVDGKRIKICTDCIKTQAKRALAAA